jgi:hypothetical protein
MSEFNYLAEKRRHLDSTGRTGGGCTGAKCGYCVLNPANNGHGIDCFHFEMNYPEEATEAIRKWSEEHPRITNADKFREVFGDIPQFKNKGCDKCLESTPCDNCDWWDEEYKPPKS